MLVIVTAFVGSMPARPQLNVPDALAVKTSPVLMGALGGKTSVYPVCAAVSIPNVKAFPLLDTKRSLSPVSDATTETGWKNLRVCGISL
jgi:hypothetical protein